MKLFGIISLLALSQLALAKPTSLSPQSVTPVIYSLQSPLAPQVTCDEISRPECELISRSVCTIETPNNGLEEFRQSVIAPMRNSKGGVNNDPQSMMALFRASEEALFRRISVSEQQIRSHVDQVKNQMIGMINQENSIPESTRTQMITRLRNTTFAMPSQYVEEVTQTLMQQGRTQEAARQRAVNDVINMCEDGFGENAFNNRDHVVFCPGLLYQFAVSGASNPDRFLTAMNLTIGHEFGHSIGPQHFPAVYENMGRCYNRLSGNNDYWNGSPKDGEGRAEETSADYWGTRVFALRMQEQNLRGQFGLIDLRRTTDGFCRMDEDNIYDSGRNRIDLTITRDPVIWEQLGCAAHQPPQERCGL